MFEYGQESSFNTFHGCLLSAGYYARCWAFCTDKTTHLSQFEEKDSDSTVMSEAEPGVAKRNKEKGQGQRD